jgi:hypothetical protein
MSGSLLLLPLRVGLRVVDLTARGAREVIGRAAGLAGLTPDRGGDQRAPYVNGAAEPAAPAETERAQEATPARVQPPERPVQVQTAGPAVSDEPLVDRGEPVDYDTPTPVEPTHLETEYELVEEVAEEGAEDGAGAEIRIAEPWDGYRELRAADVIDRVRGASPEELAAVELYELTSRKRQTVIAAVQRELRRR